ncbi:MAG: YgiQ family radical SAM protein, partial [Clostridia bacterium]
MAFLAVKRCEFIGQPDFVLVTGEAYVDHPSFGHAIISRLVESLGFSIAIIPQPQKDSDYTEFGEPKHAFLVSQGVVDSMVNNYTVAKIRRTKDVYSEGGVFGLRPDRATIVYTKNLKRIFPNTAVIIGGIEPSLRRFAHYDYWSDTVMPSILVDAPADLLMYGMGEKPFTELLAMVKNGVPIDKIKNIRGTAYISDYDSLPLKIKDEFYKNLICPTFEEVKADKLKYVKAFNIQANGNDFTDDRVIIQKHGKKYVVQNPAQYPLTPSEMDKSYALPYERTFHPMYTKGVPSIEEVKFSITSTRGCFGNCNYCALTYHMGRVVQKRSKQSIVEEAKNFVYESDFKGYIHDVGGPTANFRNPACAKQVKNGVCSDKNCIGFTPCQNLVVDHREYLDILRELRAIEGVKKVFIRSGIRYDYLMLDKNKEFFAELVKYHISGQLKIAPEHSQNSVLKLMNKAPFEVYQKFYDEFYKLTKKEGKEQYLVPYFISSH